LLASRLEECQEAFPPVFGIFWARLMLIERIEWYVGLYIFFCLFIIIMFSIEHKCPRYKRLINI
jgi:hypothetical protein